MTAAGIGLKRVQHLVRWVSNVDRSVRFYCDVLGFEVKTRYPNAAFLRIAGSSEDHHLGLFEQPGVTGPDERAGRMSHSGWEGGALPVRGGGRGGSTAGGRWGASRIPGGALCSSRRIPAASSSRSSG